MTRKEAEQLAIEKAGISQEEIKQICQTISRFFGKKDLARQVLDIQPFYYDEAKIWWYYDKENFCWKLTDEVNLINIVSALADVNTVNSKEKNEIIEALKQEARLRKPKDISPNWIQFRETIYDVVTGDKIIASPEWFVTNPIPYKASDNAETPEMDKLFTEWVGKDYVDTLYEIIAYCLLPDYPIHRLFCFVGAGLNGKGCFLRMVEKFIGKDNCTSTELDTLLNSRFEITKLHKKLVCTMGETNFNELSRTSILKRLTGGDSIGFEYKNKTPFDDKNYAKILIATNNLPTTTDKTIGFYRRWMIIDFPNQFTEKTDVLSRIPESEYNNLAIKSIIYLNKLLKTREFSKEGSIEERTKKFEDRSNPLDKFLKEFCNLENPEGHIFKYDFEKKFNQWCLENRFRTYSDVVIGKEMKERGIISLYKSAFWLNDNKGGQLRAWIGISWK